MRRRPDLSGYGGRLPTPTHKTHPSKAACRQESCHQHRPTGGVYRRQLGFRGRHRDDLQIPAERPQTRADSGRMMDLETARRTVLDSLSFLNWYPCGGVAPRLCEYGSICGVFRSGRRRSRRRAHALRIQGAAGARPRVPSPSPSPSAAGGSWALCGGGARVTPHPATRRAAKTLTGGLRPFSSPIRRSSARRGPRIETPATVGRLAPAGRRR